MIWFKPTGSASSVYVRYTVSGQSQLNYAMTYNNGTGRWEQAISLAHGQTVTYFFDDTPSEQGQGYQNETGRTRSLPSLHCPVFAG